MSLKKIFFSSALALLCVFSTGCNPSNVEVVTPSRPVDSEADQAKKKEALDNSNVPDVIKRRMEDRGNDNRKRPGDRNP